MLAFCIDALIIYALLKGVWFLVLLSPWTLYFPFELVWVCAYGCYCALFTAWKGYTPGKWLLNLTVIRAGGGRLAVPRSILRETVGKFLSAIVWGMGFFWIGFTRRKRGWHDLIAGSVVRKNPVARAVTPYVRYAMIVLVACFFGKTAGDFYGTYRRARALSIGNGVEYAFMTREPGRVTDVAGLSPETDTLYSRWIADNSLSAEAYALRAAAGHQVVLFGEQHEIGDCLDLLNRIIAPLYHESGVRCIAMECISYKQNRRLEKIVNGERFDAESALAVARSMNWKMWGMKEYWDVMETVWWLNRSLPEGAPRMRLIGIDEPWDGPRMAYVTRGEDGMRNFPKSEWLKGIQIVSDLPVILWRDELMAYHIEKEIIERGDKGIVWIGSAHIFADAAVPWPGGAGEEIRMSNPRVGVLLHRKYGSEVFSLWLYDGRRGGPAGLGTFIERVMARGGERSVGFTLAGSPFGLLRDTASFPLSRHPALALQDLYEGMVFLNPGERLRRCGWTENYISKAMFMRYKPFYCSKFGQDFTGPDEVNLFFESLFP